MKGTIYELWNGRIPHAAMYDEGREEAENLRNLILTNRKELCTALNEEQKCTLEKYDACTDELHDFYTEKAFCDGFTLAMRIAAETLA